MLLQIRMNILLTGVVHLIIDTYNYLLLFQRLNEFHDLFIT